MTELISLLIGLIGTISGVIGTIFGYYGIFISNHGIKKTEELANNKNTFSLSVLRVLLNYINSEKVEISEGSEDVKKKSLSGRFINSKNIHERNISITMCPALTIPFYKVLYMFIITIIAFLPTIYLYPIFIEYMTDGNSIAVSILWLVLFICSFCLGLIVSRYFFGDQLFSPAIITFRGNTVTIEPLVRPNSSNIDTYNKISLDEKMKFIRVNIQQYYPYVKGLRMKGLALNIDGVIYNITSAPLFICKIFDCIDLENLKDALNEELAMARQQIESSNENGNN